MFGLLPAHSFISLSGVLHRLHIVFTKKLNEEADVRSQLSSVNPNMKAICKNVKWMPLFLVLDMGSQFSDQGFNQGCKQWKCQVLTTRPPANSLYIYFDIQKLTCWDLDWNYIESIGQVGTKNILTILTLSVREYGIYLSTYLAPLWFLSSMFCIFPHRDLVHTLLDL